MIGGVLVASRMIRTILANDRAEVEMQVLGEQSARVFTYEIKSLDGGWFQTFACVASRDVVSGEWLSDVEFSSFSTPTDSLQALRLWTHDTAKEKARDLARYFRKKGEKVSTRTVR